MMIEYTVNINSSYSAGASLSVNCKDIIEATLSANVSLSVETEIKEEQEYTIPPHKYGRIAFTPRGVHTKGTFFEKYDQVGGTIYTQKTPVDVKYLVETGAGTADGLYEPVIRNSYFH